MAMAISEAQTSRSPSCPYWLLITITLSFTYISALEQRSSKSGALSFSAKELNALEEFRELVKDALYADYMSTDGYLIRWIRDRDFDLEAANHKLRKSLEWRRRTGIDTSFEDPVLQALNKTYPVQLAGYDRTGSPVITVSPGMWKIRKMVLNGMQDAVYRHLQSSLELGQFHVTKLQKEGKNVTQMIFLSDLTGFNLREHVCLACLPVYTSTAISVEANYPEILKKVLVFNVPKIFDNIFALITPIFSIKTRKLISLYGFNRNEWQEAIFALISPEQLTMRYGGTRES